MQAMWWCGPQARSAFFCIKQCRLLPKRPIFYWARAEPALAKRVSWQGGAREKCHFLVINGVHCLLGEFCAGSENQLRTGNQGISGVGDNP